MNKGLTPWWMADTSDIKASLWRLRRVKSHEPRAYSSTPPENSCRITSLCQYQYWSKINGAFSGTRSLLSSHRSLHIKPPSRCPAKPPRPCAKNALRLPNNLYSRTLSHNVGGCRSPIPAPSLSKRTPARSKRRSTLTSCNSTLCSGFAIEYGSHICRST